MERYRAKHPVIVKSSEFGDVDKQTTHLLEAGYKIGIDCLETDSYTGRCIVVLSSGARMPLGTFKFCFEKVEEELGEE